MSLSPINISRHLYDHFRILLSAVQSASLSDAIVQVNYDKRERDVPLERNVAMAIVAMKSIQSILNDIEVSNAATPLMSIQLQATMDPHSEHQSSFATSFGRELWFCCSHATHHYALIKAICYELGVSTPGEFGVAPSTLRSQQGKNM
ncbi:hypothetical protein BC938DRAFT_476239 [Jimgerdemannia flammicorona]|uniref:DinB-like domain-containing protein n=1 Tax=Jimgerdemannia flammicorona TaxID=994334 RepID=A0A433QQR4_9FUNG|nr:hypothetical protein BC938DRAFT_476239 [Jimgerdemannia flammicorona]